MGCRRRRTRGGGGVCPGVAWYWGKGKRGSAGCRVARNYPVSFLACWGIFRCAWVGQCGVRGGGGYYCYLPVRVRNSWVTDKSRTPHFLDCRVGDLPVGCKLCMMQASPRASSNFLISLSFSFCVVSGGGGGASPLFRGEGWTHLLFPSLVSQISTATITLIFLCTVVFFWRKIVRNKCHAHLPHGSHILNGLVHNHVFFLCYYFWSYKKI